MLRDLPVGPCGGLIVGVRPALVGATDDFRIGLVEGDIISAWRRAIFGATERVLGPLVRLSGSVSEISDSRESTLDGRIEGDVSSLLMIGTSIALDDSTC